MFTKPKHKIGDTVYIIIENGVDADVYKTEVESYEFSLSEGWYVRVRKIWTNVNMFLFHWDEVSKDTLIHNSSVFSSEEDAKEHAETVAEELVESAKVEKIKQLTESIKLTEAKLAEDKKELSKLSK